MQHAKAHKTVDRRASFSPVWPQNGDLFDGRLVTGLSITFEETVDALKRLMTSNSVSDSVWNPGSERSV